MNQTVDNMGFYNALNACFTLHELNHAHWAWVNEDRFPCPEDSGIPNWKEAPPIVPAVKDKVRAEVRPGQRSDQPAYRTRTRVIAR